MDNRQKWVVVKSLNMKRYNTKDRFIFAHNTENNYVYSMGYVLKTGDFSLDKDVISVVKENSSVTFVPKVLHKSKKGIFYNAFGTRTYLNDLEEKELQSFIECFMNQASSNNEPIESYSYEDIKEY